MRAPAIIKGPITAPLPASSIPIILFIEILRWNSLNIIVARFKRSKCFQKHLNQSDNRIQLVLKCSLVFQTFPLYSEFYSKEVKMTKCIECEAEISLPEGLEKGEVIDCPECGVELEVVNAESGELRVAEVEGEDWGQ
jgi:alpha-aminoadipate carrier protein LysW